MTDVLDRLKQIAALKVGDPMPESLGGDSNNWGPPLTELLKDAIAEIERLRSLAGVVSEGPSFREIKQEIKDGV